MNATLDLARIVQAEREARIREDHLAAVAACARHCCNTSLSSRLARALRLAPVSC
jgi:hypothetical protein